ncbi:SLOG family protein (plasmid) [Isosphaeraceae bacterium EP7]
MAAMGRTSKERGRGLDGANVRQDSEIYGGGLARLISPNSRGSPMRVIVTGDRDWSLRPTMTTTILKLLIAEHGPDLVIVHGGARGVDQAFKLACQELGIACEEHPARWDELG